MDCCTTCEMHGTLLESCLNHRAQRETATDENCQSETLFVVPTVVYEILCYVTLCDNGSTY